MDKIIKNCIITEGKHGKQKDFYETLKRIVLLVIYYVDYLGSVSNIKRKRKSKN